jgi:hypothetical protein
VQKANGILSKFHQDGSTIVYMGSKLHTQTIDYNENGIIKKKISGSMLIVMKMQICIITKKLQASADFASVLSTNHCTKSRFDYFSGQFKKTSDHVTLKVVKTIIGSVRNRSLSKYILQLLKL